MSKPMQAAVIILFVLLVGSAGIAGFFLLQNQKLSQENQSLQTRLEEYKGKETDLLSRARKLEKDQQDLNEKIQQKEKERDDAKQAYEGLKSKVDDLTRQASQAKSDSDDYKGRLETIRQERDDLMEKLKNQKEKVVEKIVEKVVYRDREVSGSSSASGEGDTAAPASDNGDTAAPAVPQNQNDQYWANVLKEKTALKLDLEKAQAELDQSALQVVELKKQNAEIQLELKNLTDAKADLEKQLARDKEEYERKVKYSEDLANSLSMEVARTRSQQQEAVDRVEKYKQDSLGLQEQIKQLATTKLALEKTIAQINQDKVKMERRLNQSEGVIQGRIDEIWKIKQNLDQKIQQLPSVKDASTEVQLTPIVVNPTAKNASNEVPKAQAQKAEPQQKQSFREPAVAVAGKDEGTIISINEPNNFVIVDLGENDASQIGRKLTVLRDGQQVGALEVIQVRKDISAADIKDAKDGLRVGDIVRFN